MSSVLDHRYEYLNNPYFKKHEYGNFSSFYITITICSIFLFAIIILNIVLGCCTRHSTYWQDRHTGNRWLVALWTATPHQQPSLDYTELESVEVVHHRQTHRGVPTVFERPPSPNEPPQYLELQKRESEI
ncbi:unnamed protein product [Phyllotreta striolata]|uniref:Uncharacterized protein n=1 Tax=Phyllotreta striolata TaxID=444603 RepID=A0A9N9TKS8_PHYSR|nr:unnamed protein product [Phyllotreta striolata]